MVILQNGCSSHSYSWRAAHFQHVCAIPSVKDDPIPGALGQLGQLSWVAWGVNPLNPKYPMLDGNARPQPVPTFEVNGEAAKHLTCHGWMAGHGFHPFVGSIHGELIHEAQRHPMLRNPSSSSSMCGPWWTLVDLFCPMDHCPWGWILWVYLDHVRPKDAEKVKHLHHSFWDFAHIYFDLVVLSISLRHNSSNILCKSVNNKFIQIPCVPWSKHGLFSNEGDGHQTIFIGTIHIYISIT